MLLRRHTVLLADNHPIMLVGLREILAPLFKVIETATDGYALLEAVERRRPDLIITDISLSGLNGIEATCRIQTMAPGLPVLIFSIHDDPAYLQAAFEAGARGYLTKTSTPAEIQHAVDEVLAGRFYISPEVARAAFLPAARSLERPPPAVGETFSQREMDILLLLGEGLGNQEIARRLGLAVTTVRTHLSSIYGKLRLKSRVELALYATQIGGMAPDTWP